MTDQAVRPASAPPEQPPAPPAPCAECGSTKHTTGNHNSGVGDDGDSGMNPNGNHNSGSTGP